MKERIEIVSASAGTGKTYEITERLKEALLSNRARPEAVVATTFTRKAAAELHERTRRALLSNDRPDLAQGLGAARIGTVNSVCGSIVEDLALELGLAPGLRVLDEEAARREIGRALTRASSTEEQRTLAAIGSRMRDESWEDAVRRLVEIARIYGFEAERLRVFAERSADEIAGALGPAADDGDAIERELADALEACKTFVAGADKVQKYVTTAVQRAERLVRDLRKTNKAAWGEWRAVAELGESKAAEEPAIARLGAAAAAHRVHPLLHSDLRTWIGLVFEIAVQGLESYEQHKRELGVIDFVDQESYALAALRDPAIRPYLESEIDLVLVDEFQDTSPIQLEIFLELARLAPESIWVGDQKQSIYGFRDADPALMEAVVDEILAGAEPRSLGTSYRSRPELVARTSEIFATAFAAHGIPESLVRIDSAVTDEPPGLGPVFERWTLTKPPGSRGLRAPAVADAVGRLLADTSVHVRDRATKEARPLAATDVALICRTNNVCHRVAGALEAAGIAANVQRKGLADTHEASLVLAGLALWSDPRDPLAAAELARLGGSRTEDEWLARTLDPDAPLPFADLPELRAIERARERSPDLGLAAVVECVVEATGARERCLEWGDAQERLANLDALGAYAVGFAEHASADGGAATITRLLGALEGQRSLDDRDRDDEQAVPATRPAVSVLTYHGAKGLEWPVAILLEATTAKEADNLGVSLGWEDDANVRLDAPRAGRWARYWPNPYSARTKNSDYHRALAAHPASDELSRRTAEETLRVLYVGWTRARDRLVIASHVGDLDRGMLSHLGAASLSEPELPEGAEDGEDGTASWGGPGAAVRVREGTPSNQPPPATTPGAGPVPRGPRPFPPARIAPSELRTEGTIEQEVTIGERLALKGSSDMRAVGEAMHGFFAADRSALDDTDRLALAAGILERWGVADALDAAELVTAGDRLRAFVEARWPGARWRRELPLSRKAPDGSVIAGAADLVVETDEECAVIDHKSFPGGLDGDDERLGEFAGQLGAYAEVMERAQAGKRVSAWVHQGVAGRVSRIR